MAEGGSKGSEVVKEAENEKQGGGGGRGDPWDAALEQ